MKKKSIVSLIVIAALAISMLSVGLISAYFTDTETQTNVFTVGKIDVELLEPNWAEPTNILPEQEFAKDPQIKNVGVNDAYVFMEVEVPYANIVTATDDGSKNASADTELFTYEVNDGWVLMGSGEKNETNKTVTYLYAYAVDNEMTVLNKDATTNTLFDYIKFVNVVDGQGIEGGIQNVVVKAYAVQTTNINDGKATLDGNNSDGKVTPAEVWSVISK